MKILLIIPAYNEENCITKVIDELVERYPQYDYIIVNDGSTDHTSEICHKSGYEIIDLPINLGLAGAFQTGLKYAYLKNYDYAMQMDADGQHLPEYVKTLIKEIENGSDIVIGSRFVTKKKPFTMRMLGSFMISTVIKLTTGRKIKDPTSGMRAFSKTVLKECAEKVNYGPEPDTMAYFIKQGKKVEEVQVEMTERVAGESYLNFSRSIMYMLRMMISLIFIQSFRD